MVAAKKLRAMAADLQSVPGFTERALEREAEQLQRNLRFKSGTGHSSSRGGRWVQSDLGKRRKSRHAVFKCSAMNISRLVNRYGRRLTQYLAGGTDPIVLELDGEIYLFEP